MARRGAFKNSFLRILDKSDNNYFGGKDFIGSGILEDETKSINTQSPNAHK